MRTYLKPSYLGSVTALGVSACCVLPMVMLLLGAGGTWLAVFGRIAALSYPVLALSSAIVALAWLLAWRRGTLARLGFWLAGSTGLTALAWFVVTNEAAINQRLMMWM